jgi:hypothetical protein
MEHPSKIDTVFNAEYPGITSKAVFNCFLRNMTKLPGIISTMSEALWM